MPGLVAAHPVLRDRGPLVSAAIFTRTDDDVSTLLARRAAALGDKPFVTFTHDPPDAGPDVAFTYREFDARVNQVARGLIELGIGRRDFVGLLLPNCAEFLLSSYAIKRLGAVEVAIATGYAGTALARMIALTGTRTLITSSAYLDSVLAIRSEVPALETIVLTDFDADRHGSRGPLALRSFDSLVAEDDRDLGLPAPSYADLASILFTSGSTGLSKGVMLSHRCEVRFGDVDAALLELTGEDIRYTFYPLYNTGAALCELMPTLVAGGSAVIAPRFSASRLWQELRRHRATWFLMQGTVSKILWDQPPSADERSHHLRFAWAAPLAGDQRAFEKRFGCAIVVDDIYGTSECGMLLPAEPGTDGKDRIVHRIAIVDELDREVPQGSTGEIVVRGLEPYAMFDGYFGDPQATWARCRNLWYHTGDRGRLEADGTLTFLGRTGEMIRARGKNVSALEVEAAVLKLGQVAQCGVIGAPSEMGEDDIVAYVALKDGSPRVRRDDRRPLPAPPAELHGPEPRALPRGHADQRDRQDREGPAPSARGAGTMTGAPRRIGIDTGGTFTDCVLVDAQTHELTIAKVPSLPSEPQEAIAGGIERLLAGAEGARAIESVVHGTTIATNAVITGDLARIGVLTTRGFRDVLEIGTQMRPSLYDLHQVARPAIAPRDLRLEVAGRLAANGTEVEPIDPERGRACGAAAGRGRGRGDRRRLPVLVPQSRARVGDPGARRPTSRTRPT